ncbi:hypothetical protein FOCC_FOCC009475 [Frankliniella occidentalis]|nr:hypothetical protein FOCC_FOCC009475 [Frankliniella occidentalis]
MTESIITPAASVADIRVYGRRWVILALFSLVLMLNSMPWSQYTVLEDVVTEYYGVSSSQVEWTGLVYNVTAMVLVLPAAWFLEKYGVRAAVTVGIVGTTLGLSVRIVGCWPRHFWAVIVGQAIVGASTNFLTSAPTRVAALWFPAKEVSSALAATMIGQTRTLSPIIFWLSRLSRAVLGDNKFDLNEGVIRGCWHHGCFPGILLCPCLRVGHRINIPRV